MKLNQLMNRVVGRMAAALCLSLASGIVPATASEPVMRVGMVRVSTDEEAVIPIEVDHPDGIVAAVFTIRFDTDALEVSGWESPLFPSFQNQYAAVGAESPFGSHVTYGGTDYDRPVRVRLVPEGVRFAGVRLPVEPAMANTNERRLLVLRLRLGDGAPPGFYPIQVEPTVLRASAGGYPPNGEAVDPLLTIRLGPLSVQGFPRVLTASDMQAAQRPGSAAFASPFVDALRNGLDDEWETFYFGQPGVASPFDDDDGDGLINFLEMFHGTDPTEPSALAMRLALDGARLLVDFPIGPHLLPWEMQWSNDLRTWNLFPPDALEIETRAAVDSPGLRATASLPQPQGDSVFIRIGVRLNLAEEPAD